MDGWMVGVVYLEVVQWRNCQVVMLWFDNCNGDEIVSQTEVLSRYRSF